MCDESRRHGVLIIVLVLACAFSFSLGRITTQSMDQKEQQMTRALPDSMPAPVENRVANADSGENSSINSDPSAPELQGTQLGRTD